MSGESDEFNFASIIPTRLVEGIPSVFPECVKEKIEESIFSNWQLLSSWGVFLPIQTSISPFPFSGRRQLLSRRGKVISTQTTQLWGEPDLEFVKSFIPVRLKKSQFYPGKTPKSRQPWPNIENGGFFSLLFWTNCQFCLIIYSNTNSLQCFVNL